MYHKVDIITPSRWWVSVDNFEKQIALLRKKFELVYLDQYKLGSKTQAVITFDDSYENIFNHAFPILKKNGVPFEVFINGGLLGGWNDFDKEELFTKFCGLEHLNIMSNFGGRMQWHSKNHKSLPGLSADKLKVELDITDDLRAMFPSPHFRWFAYPYGMHDERTVENVRGLFYGALSVIDGSDSDRYMLNRVIVDDLWVP